MLMAAPRSMDSWDVLVRKTDDGIWLDMREDSNLDLMTVNETSSHKTTDDVESINHRANLSREATYINHMFAEQVLGHHRHHHRPPPSLYSIPYVHLDCETICDR